METKRCPHALILLFRQFLFKTKAINRYAFSSYRWESEERCVINEFMRGLLGRTAAQVSELNDFHDSSVREGLMEGVFKIGSSRQQNGVQRLISMGFRLFDSDHRKFLRSAQIEGWNNEYRLQISLLMRSVVLKAQYLPFLHLFPSGFWQPTNILSSSSLFRRKLYHI